MHDQIKAAVLAGAIKGHYERTSARSVFSSGDDTPAPEYFSLDDYAASQASLWLRGIRDARIADATLQAIEVIRELAADS